MPIAGRLNHRLGGRPIPVWLPLGTMFRSSTSGVLPMASRMWRRSGILELSGFVNLGAQIFDAAINQDCNNRGIWPKALCQP